MSKTEQVKQAVEAYNAACAMVLDSQYDSSMAGHNSVQAAAQREERCEVALAKEGELARVAIACGMTGRKTYFTGKIGTLNIDSRAQFIPKKAITARAKSAIFAREFDAAERSM